ncbi:hypothetical protein ADK38_29990 [Streptomyces varsoviensis]|uniref:MarR family transcriptional regulator n=2 Tax=Streptomyces varsoviensis TaxID=67373 RepID=A0ABR5IZN0_9ACTN|nr:hypothetical protein ADK38_29990 [Streptomyces varsoviensis]
MASPGYGKRSAPSQLTRTAHDFAHLPRREASVAAYLDRLPDGADISVKTLAKVLPDYGQCALRTALRRLSEAGHLRRVAEHHWGEDGSPRWVTRTYFSRTARDDAWWMAFCAGNVPDAEPPRTEPERATRSEAYDSLAALGRAEPRLTLSANDCASLEALAAEWFARGATPAQFLHALTDGLPPAIRHAGGFTRARLIEKMPPPPPWEPAGTRPAPLRTLECTVCGLPNPAKALPGGVCGPCRGESPPDRHPPALPPARVHAHADKARAAVTRSPERSHA